MITKEIQEKYLAKGGVVCPYCDCRNLAVTGPAESDFGVAWQPVTCMDCKREWVDHYTLTSIAEEQGGKTKS